MPLSGVEWRGIWHCYETFTCHLWSKKHRIVAWTSWQVIKFLFAQVQINSCHISEIRTLISLSFSLFQLMASHPLDEVFSNSNNRQPNHLMHHQMTQNPENQPPQNQHQQLPQNEQPKKPRPHPDQALKCPRCDSTNTKFCYYNNYSLSQPRYVSCN